jgi:hypothetical protein
VDDAVLIHQLPDQRPVGDCLQRIRGGLGGQGNPALKQERGGDREDTNPIGGNSHGGPLGVWLLAHQIVAGKGRGTKMDRSVWRRFLLIAVLGTFLAPVSTAHHSTAEFDYTKQVTIKGIVKEVQWTNPHSFIQLMVDGSSGEKVQWSVEIGSPSLNVNMGWRKNSVKAGDIVTMELSPARNGKPYGTLRVLTFADGQQLNGVAARVRGPVGAPPPAVAPPKDP